MVEWWEVAHKELTKQNITRKSIQDIVESCLVKVTFREKTHEVCRILFNRGN
jgi:hypothetical protein